MDDYVQELTEALYEHRHDAIRVSFRDWSGPDFLPAEQDCPSNVDRWCRLHAEQEPVRGWLVNEYVDWGYCRFVAHSVVRGPQGGLFGLTPPGLALSYPFLLYSYTGESGLGPPYPKRPVRRSKVAAAIGKECSYSTTGRRAMNNKDPHRRPRMTRLGRIQIARLYSFAEGAITLIGLGIPLVFAVYRFADLGLSEFIEGLNPGALRDIALTLYFFGWTFGAKSDARAMSSVYVLDPEQGKMPFEAWAAVAFIGVMAILLLWQRENEVRFAILLLVFSTVDIGTWFVLLIRTRPVIRASAEAYAHENDYAGLGLLEEVVAYNTANWHLTRQGVFYVIIGVMLVVSLSATWRMEAVSVLHALFPAVSSTALNALLFPLLVVTFVAISEITIFAMRAKREGAIGTILELEERFEFEPKSPTVLVRKDCWGYRILKSLGRMKLAKQG